MLAKTALPALLLMAQSAGVDVDKVKAPKVGPVQAVASEKKQPTPILKISFREIEDNQKRAIERRNYGSAKFDFSMAFAPKEPWVKVSEDYNHQAFRLSELEKGLATAFPSGLWELNYRGGFVQLHQPYDQPGVPRVRVSLPMMARNHYNLALHIQFAGLVEYAVFYEDGSPIPLSVSLLREDSQGRLWITDGSYDRIKNIHWFLAINGVLYGMRREGLLLVFYSKPVPSMSTWMNRVGVYSPFEREVTFPKP